MNRTMLAAALAAFLLSGCAAVAWAPLDGRAANPRDEAECDHQMIVATAGIRDDVTRIIARQDIWQSCMRLRGYGPRPAR